MPAAALAETPRASVSRSTSSTGHPASVASTTFLTAAALTPRAGTFSTFLAEAASSRPAARRR